MASTSASGMTPGCALEPEGMSDAFVRMVLAREKWHRTMRHPSAYTADGLFFLMHLARRYRTSPVPDGARVRCSGRDRKHPPYRRFRPGNGLVSGAAACATGPGPACARQSSPATRARRANRCSTAAPSRSQGAQGPLRADTGFWLRRAGRSSILRHRYLSGTCPAAHLRGTRAADIDRP